MQQYLNILKRILEEGTWSDNRTGIRTKFVHGVWFEHDMSTGFPLLTTKEVNWRSAFAETLGFIKGFDNAKQFRELGTKVWDANANETKSWLESPYRKGEDDLGRIYGVQSRYTPKWVREVELSQQECRDVYTQRGCHDQLNYVIGQLKVGTDNRRLIIDHWNVDDVMQNRISLPPCHYSMQFGIEKGKLNLVVNFRSHDTGLGYSFNLAGYGLMLEVVAKITGLTSGRLMFSSFNTHIYENHLDMVHQQLTREPRSLPRLVINDRVTDLHYLEDESTVDDFVIIGYNPHPAIRAKMAA